MYLRACVIGLLLFLGAHMRSVLAALSAAVADEERSVVDAGVAAARVLGRRAPLALVLAILLPQERVRPSFDRVFRLPPRSLARSYSRTRILKFCLLRWDSYFIFRRHVVG